MRDHEQVKQNSRLVIVFDGEDSHEAIVFDGLTSAIDWIEPIDVDEGGYEKIAWFDDGEVIEVGVEQIARADLRVKLTATGQRDFPALREALTRTHPELAAADVTAVHDFAVEELAFDAAWRASHWHRRLHRWLLRRRPH